MLDSRGRDARLVCPKACAASSAPPDGALGDQPFLNGAQRKLVASQNPPTAMAMTAQEVIRPRYQLVLWDAQRAATRPITHENAAMDAIVPTAYAAR